MYINRIKILSLGATGTYSGYASYAGLNNSYGGNVPTVSGVINTTGTQNITLTWTSVSSTNLIIYTCELMKY